MLARTSCSRRSIRSPAPALPARARGHHHRHGGLHPRSAEGSGRARSARRSRRWPTPTALHVVDASDPAREEQIRAVEGILARARAREKPRLIVCNKADQLETTDADHLARHGRASWCPRSIARPSARCCSGSSARCGSTARKPSSRARRRTRSTALRAHPSKNLRRGYPTATRAHCGSCSAPAETATRNPVRRRNKAPTYALA